MQRYLRKHYLTYIVLIAFCFTLTAPVSSGLVLAAEKRLVDFNGPKPEGEPIAKALSFPSYEFWYHGVEKGYWRAGLHGGHINLYDRDINEAMKKQGIIPYDEVITDRVPLPEEVKKYFQDGGKPEDLIVYFQFWGSARPQDVFVDNRVEYLITEQYLELSFRPIFKIEPGEPIYNGPGMKVTIPRIKEGYGSEGFAIYDKKTKKKIGASYTGKYFSNPFKLDYIANSDGYLKPGHTIDVVYYEGDTHNPANRKVVQVKTDDVMIGTGGFSSGAAVGLNFIYPINIWFYKKNGPDFYPTPDYTNKYNYEWKQKPARTYMGEPGQQINVEVYLWNGGTETATTNIAATWYGKGWQA